MPEPIPQHDTSTEGGEGEKKGGIFHKLFEKHGMIWLIGIGGATLVVMFMVMRNNANNAANAANAANPNGSLPIDPATGIPPQRIRTPAYCKAS